MVIIDLFIATDGKTPHQLYRNRGDGTYALDVRSDEAAVDACHGCTRFTQSISSIMTTTVGWIYGLLVNHEQPIVAAFSCFGTMGQDVLPMSSTLLPETIRSGSDGAVGDYDNDGALDLFLIDPDGGVAVLRNDGGDQNNWLEVKLKGIDAGNNKNNIDGIGAKVELKAGELYQMKYVTTPLTHFGLGKEKQGDVLRVVWTKWSPTKTLSPPNPNQRILEKQVLKGSCPFLYVYDGSGYQFVTDLLWRSPLGMVTPMGFLAAAGNRRLRQDSR